MLTELTIQSSTARPLLRRPMGAPPTVERDTRSGSIALAGLQTSFARNTQIYREKEPAAHLYKVTSGTVRTCKVLVDGRRHIGAFYLPGDLFGLEPGAEYTASAEAVVDAEVLVIRRSMATFSSWDDEMICLMRHELQRTQEHLLLLIKTAPERVATFLLEMAARASIQRRGRPSHVAPGRRRPSWPHDRDRVAHADATREPIRDRTPHGQADRAAQSRRSETADRLTYPLRSVSTAHASPMSSA